MLIFPAIDLRKGKCVRLLQGQASKETVYDCYPLAVALRWEQERAQWAASGGPGWRLCGRIPTGPARGQGNCEKCWHSCRIGGGSGHFNRSGKH